MSYCNISSSQQDFFNNQKDFLSSCTTKDFRNTDGSRLKCYDCNCPVHGEKELNERYQRAVTLIDKRNVNDGFRSWILTVDNDSGREELAYLLDLVKDIFNTFDSNDSGVKFYVEHDIIGNRHLNVGIGHKKLKEGNYRVTHNTIRSSSRRGRPVKYDETWLDMAMINLDFPCLRKITKGAKKYYNDMTGWLHYCMRQDGCQYRGEEPERVRGCTGHSFRHRRRK